MANEAFDSFAFEIELQKRGVGLGHRRRKKPFMSEMDAHCSSKEVAKWLSANYEIRRKPETMVADVATKQWGRATDRPQNASWT